MREKPAVLYQNFDNISISFFFLGSFLVSLIGLWVSSGPSILLEVLVSTFGDRLVVDFSLLIEWENENNMVFGFCWVLADMISFEDS
ncbi:unnamed protein product [Rhizophagus irregularis]|nr:unnamed protein product [Rhizophagus irregularis]